MDLSKAQKEEEELKKIELKENPEDLKKAIYALQDLLHKNNQFHGTFRKGKIDGVYFSRLWIESRKTVSFVKIRGNYNLESGDLKFTVSKSTAFFVSVGIMVCFALAGSIMSLKNDAFPLVLMIFSISFACIAIGLYFVIFYRNQREFIRLVQSYFMDELDI